MDTAHEADAPRKQGGTELSLRVAEAGWLALILSVALLLVSCAFPGRWFSGALDVLWIAGGLFAVAALGSGWARGRFAGWRDWLAGCRRQKPEAARLPVSPNGPKCATVRRPQEDSKRDIHAERAQQVTREAASLPAGRSWRIRQIKRKLAKTPMERLAGWSLTAGVFGCFFFCTAHFLCNMAMKTKEWISTPLTDACAVGVLISFGLLVLSTILRILLRAKAGIERRRSLARSRRLRRGNGQ